jgi:hypothetical protein
LKFSENCARLFRVIRIFLTAFLGLSAAQGGIDFARDVRPILSSHCFKCHGQDEGTRKGGLRLDQQAAAYGEGKSGARAIVPGQLELSEVIRRVVTTDVDEVMPPPAAKHPLAQAQIDILRQWIAEGGRYVDHWAFTPPAAVTVPGVKNATWPRGPIDHFILAALEARELEPSPEADRHALLRRVTLDLTGLLPTLSDADAFLNDNSPDAYEKVVDRLLASPHYGERWARLWLDLARYADSNGYEKDRPRPMWPWRDWVIRALNADLSFRDFTIAQLAGDLLPNANDEQRVATGFHRNTMLNEEGGIDPLEFRFHAMTDRVATTGATWLGLTVGCAQCHTHKYDPILHTEYFQLMAFLNNTEEPSFYLSVPDDPGQRARKTEELFAALPAQWKGDKPLAEAEANWRRQVRAAATVWQALVPTRMESNLPKLTHVGDGRIRASGDFSKDDQLAVSYDVPAGTTSLRLEALPHPDLPDDGPGMTYYEGPRGDYFISDLAIMHEAKELAVARVLTTSGNGALMGDANLQSGWSGPVGERAVAVFILAHPWPGGPLTIRFNSGRHYAATLAHFRFASTTRPDGGSALALEPEVENALATLGPELISAALEAQLRRAFLLSAPELAEPAQAIRALSRPARGQETFVLRERASDHPRPTHLHHRGEYLQPKEVVTASVPAFLPALPAEAPRNRLGFAEWLVSPTNPLTARVAVNRAWAAFFGRGLVKTLADFGYQGELPSHPELLDFLAREFMADGWSLRRLHRRLVLSATYRQSSHVTAKALAADPENRYLARGPRFRVEAEMVRDLILQAAGLLSPKMYGPPVRPPQPASVTEAIYGSNKWEVSQGEDRYRRALYTYAKRSAPFAAAVTFDAPSGEACVPQRDRSNTPLQSLTLLNDEVFVEAARALGQRALEVEGDDSARLAIIFRRCLTRPVREAEARPLLSLLAETRARLASGELRAAEIAPDGNGDARERAAWTIIARVLLNLDETITKS